MSCFPQENLFNVTQALILSFIIFSLTFPLIFLRSPIPPICYIVMLFNFRTETQQLLRILDFMAKMTREIAKLKNPNYVFD